MVSYNKEERGRDWILDTFFSEDLIAIQERLKSNDPLERIDAVKALESIADPLAVDVLISYLLKNQGHLDIEDSVYPLVIQILGWRQDPRAIPALKTVESDLLKALSELDPEDLLGYRDAFEETLELTRMSMTLIHQRIRIEKKFL